MGKLIDVEECMRRSRRIAQRLGETFEIIACGPDICNVSHYFHDVRERRLLPREWSLDLVKGIAALSGKISRTPDGANGSVFILSTDSGQKNYSARPRNGDGFRESSLGPLT